MQKPPPLPGKAISTLAFCCLVASATASFGDTYKLGPRVEPGACHRVQAVLEVRGELRLNADGREVKTLPLEVEGRFVYDERILESSEEPWRRRSVRGYEEASAKIKAGDGLVNRNLAASHRVLFCRATGESISLYSPGHPLSREELDLVDIQGNSLLVDGLLPSEPVELGGTWKPNSQTLARLFGWEVVTQSDVQARLADVKENVALVEFSGRLDGAVGGVASEIELSAKCNFDLKRRMVTWYAVSLREKRSIGHAEPGFEVTARLRMALQPTSVPPELSPETLAELDVNTEAAAELLTFQSEFADFRLIHDRRWHAMIDRHDLTVFRLVDRSDLIAQCNITELPDFEAGRYLSLDEFQAEIQQKLGEHFGQIVEATQTSVEEGNRILRVVVSGMASDIPIHWIYYHLANEQGRRAAIAFTFESELLERFAETDQTIVETFEFLPRTEPEEARRPEESPSRS